MGNFHSSKTKIPKKFLEFPKDRFPVPKNLDIRRIRNLINKKKLAPFMTPSDVKIEDSEQCPICLMYYCGGLNICVSCSNRICSECLINCCKEDFKKRRLGYYNNACNSQCPFCKKKPFQTVFKGELSKKEKEKRMLEEQRVIQLQIERRKTMKKEEENTKIRLLQEKIKKDEEEKMKKEKLKKIDEEIIDEQLYSDDDDDDDNDDDDDDDDDGFVINKNIEQSPVRNVPTQRERSEFDELRKEFSESFKNIEQKNLTVEHLEEAWLNLAIQRSLEDVKKTIDHEQKSNNSSTFVTKVEMGDEVEVEKVDNESKKEERKNVVVGQLLNFDFDYEESKTDDDDDDLSFV